MFTARVATAILFASRIPLAYYAMYGAEQFRAEGSRAELVSTLS